MSSLKEKTVKGVLWSGLDRFFSQGIQVVFSILIARILLPSDYGVVAMLSIFLAVAQTFVDSGFGAALIRKPDRTDVDFSTVFYFNIAIAVIFYALLWLASPVIAAFYDIPVLKDITRVMGLIVVFSSISFVQGTKLTIAIDFRSRAIISIFVNALTGIAGLWLAKVGYGVWALALQPVLSSFLYAVFFWTVVRWLPKPVFSWKSFREMFSFGSRLLASSLLNTIYNNVYTLVIGKIFSSTSLGLYSKADNLVQYPSSCITNVLQKVSFPVLSTIQNEPERLADAYKQFIRLSAFVVFPLMVGLAAVADPMVRILLTDKWSGAVYLLQLLCFAMMWYPVHAINLNLLQVKGRSDFFLKLEIIKKIQGVIILCITIPFGLVAICYGRIAASLLSLVYNTYYTGKLIDYGFVQQMKDLMHILVHSIVMGLIAWGVVQLLHPVWLKLLSGVLAGAAYYIAGAYMMKFDELDTLFSLIHKKKS